MWNCPEKTFTDQNFIDADLDVIRETINEYEYGGEISAHFFDALDELVRLRAHLRWPAAQLRQALEHNNIDQMKFYLAKITDTINSENMSKV